MSYVSEIITLRYERREDLRREREIVERDDSGRRDDVADNFTAC